MPASPALLTSTTSDRFGMREVFATAYRGESSDWNARLGFAYASTFGLELLVEAAGGSQQWNDSRKQWIIGIDGGITEPAALRRIRELSHSEVRVFTRDSHLSKASLSATPRFHAKVLCISAGSELRCLLAGSANLTASALSDNPRNFEAGIALRDGAGAVSTGQQFDRWWSEAWRMSKPVTDRLIDDYAVLRDAWLRRNPDLASRLEPPSTREISSASVLWIEAGAMSGGSRNQIEFSREVVHFFGKPSRRRRFPPVIVAGKSFTNRPLSFKVTTFGVEIWRFSLPTEHQAGVRYPGRVIRFRRVSAGGTDAFEIEVADVGSADERSWRNTSNRQGYVGQTSGDRAFGFY